MESELKYFSNEGLEYLLDKNEAEIEAMKEVHTFIMEEIERRKSEPIKKKKKCSFKNATQQ